MQQRWTGEEALADALSRHKDCSVGVWVFGMDAMYRTTYVIQLWRNQECLDAGDPPRYSVEGYLR